MGVLKANYNLLFCSQVSSSNFSFGPTIFMNQRYNEIHAPFFCLKHLSNNFSYQM